MGILRNFGPEICKYEARPESKDTSRLGR